jgi:hypothetical protein
VAVGALAAAAIVLALLRYAVDLLGLVSVTVLVGFSIRTLTDWLTDSESVSGWSLAAVFAGAVGTAAAGLWLFGSADGDRMQRVGQRLPPGFTRAIEWAEDRGWGGRVLLPDDRAARRGTRDAAITGRPALTTPSGRPGRGAQPTAERSRDAGAAGQAPEAAVVDPAPRPGGTRAAPGPFATATRLSASPSRSVVGFSVRLTATVVSEGGGGVPQGTVVFRRGSVVIGSAPLTAEGAHGVARLSTVDLPVGTHELFADYVGGGAFVTSRSGGVRQIVVRN